MSYTFSAVVSNPSTINTGVFGFPSYSLPIPEILPAPRIWNSGTTFGFEPARLLSIFTKEGSTFCKARQDILISPLLQLLRRDGPGSPGKTIFCLSIISRNNHVIQLTHDSSITTSIQYCLPTTTSFVSIPTM